jgi:hypothetical protein
VLLVMAALVTLPSGPTLVLQVSAALVVKVEALWCQTV